MTQVFFLTGSSRGLGRHIAEAVLEAGHRLVATARQPASLAERYGERILPVALDVTDVTDVAAAEAAVAAGSSRSPRSAGAWPPRAWRPTRRPSGRSAASPRCWPARPPRSVSR